MKELTIEEKSRRYDEVKNKLSRFIAQGVDPLITRADVQDFFPELMESEDEKTRKEIVRFIQMEVEDEIVGNKWLAWLEKQAEQKICVNDKAKEMFIKALERVEEQNNKGYKLTDCDKNSWWEDFKVYTSCTIEQKPADKVEQKFKIGDWITNGEDLWKIINVSALDYVAQSQNGEIVHDTICFVDKHFRKWTIHDAKDGDVLTCYSDIKGQPIEQTGIIKQYVGRHGGCSNSFKAHFGVDWDNNVVIEGYMGSSNIYPSTKEQRDLLLQRMKEEEYEFDFEKKELKKIEQKPAESKQEAKPNGGIVYEDFNEGDGYYKMNLEYLSKSQVELIENLVASWQTSTNNSVEWSEEDENMLRRIFDSLNTYAKGSYPILKGVVEEEIDWLKSIRYQKQ